MRRSIRVALLALLPLGCGDDPFDSRRDLDPFTGGVSDAVDGVAWVSAAPGTQPSATTATTSLVASWVLTNTAEHPTGPVTVEVDSGPFGLVIDLDGCSGRQLAPYGVCSVSLRFAPDAPGGFPGALRFKASPGGEATSNVSGTAH